jgi:NADPH:quinone reductase-like Zn-dependent oxidoreductase
MVGGGKSPTAVLLPMLLGPLLSLAGHKKAAFFIAKVNKQDLNFLRDLLETGKVRAIIDRHYPLSEADEAIRYLEQGHARGKIVLTVGAAESRITHTAAPQ